MTSVRQNVVLLTEDWHSGAAAWSVQRPEAYADDLAAATHLAADTARSNRSNSDQGPAEGLAPAGEGHCRYLAEWEDLKLRWALSASQAEAAALGGAQMPQKSVWGDYAETRADRAADRAGEDMQIEAIGEGLSAVAYALLDIAAAIREHTESRE